MTRVKRKTQLPPRFKSVDWEMDGLEHPVVQRKKTNVDNFVVKSTGSIQKKVVMPKKVGTSRSVSASTESKTLVKPSNHPVARTFNLDHLLKPPRVPSKRLTKRPRPKCSKQIISARFQYNYSLLRRMHGCGPCLIKLVSVPLNKTLAEIESIW